MKYLAAWYGGSSYGPPYPEHWEPVPSIAAAREILLNRYANSGRWTPGVLETPAVDETSEVLLYADGAELERDPYPLYRVYFGPRLGVRVEQA